MKKNNDPLHLIKMGNPVPDPQKVANQSEATSYINVMKEINKMGVLTTAKDKKFMVKSTAIIAGLALIGVTTAAAVIWGISGGNLEEPAFAGNGWELIVGEDDNGTMEEFKVCHTLKKSGEDTEASGLGASGCVNWPDNTETRTIISITQGEAVNGNNLFVVDLGMKKVSKVNTILEGGEIISTEPFVMPYSRKQYTVIEIPVNKTIIKIQALDENGQILDKKTSEDIKKN